MRKSAAILLCGIFFFNWVGYRLVNRYMEEAATRRLDARLDAQQYNEDQLITIKVPVTDLAYYNNSASFERSNGQIELNGIPYRYVKCRIYHDSLEMLCIPDEKALTLRQSGKNYFNGVNGIEKLSDPYIGISQIRVEAPPAAPAAQMAGYSADLFNLALPTDERPPSGGVA